MVKKCSAARSPGRALHRTRLRGTDARMPRVRHSAPTVSTPSLCAQARLQLASLPPDIFVGECLTGHRQCCAQNARTRDARARGERGVATCSRHAGRWRTAVRRPSNRCVRKSIHQNLRETFRFHPCKLVRSNFRSSDEGTKTRYSLSSRKKLELSWCFLYKNPIRSASQSLCNLPAVLCNDRSDLVV